MEIIRAKTAGFMGVSLALHCWTRPWLKTPAGGMNVGFLPEQNKN